MGAAAVAASARHRRGGGSRRPSPRVASTGCGAGRVDIEGERAQEWDRRWRHGRTTRGCRRGAAARTHSERALRPRSEHRHRSNRAWRSTPMSMSAGSGERSLSGGLMLATSAPVAEFLNNSNRGQRSTAGRRPPARAVTVFADRVPVSPRRRWTPGPAARRRWTRRRASTCRRRCDPRRRRAAAGA